MKASFVRIATAKAAGSEPTAALLELEELASQYEMSERNFATRINESKAKRDESPVKLKKAQREMLQAFHADQTALDEELEQQLNALETAQEVVQALHFGMQPSIEADRKSLRHYHPDELPIGEEMLHRKEVLVAALAEFLARYPNAA